MNKIIANLIVDPGVQQPFLGKSLEFLQNATSEALSHTIIATIGSSYDATKVYILWGCVRTGAADGAGSGAAAVSAGAIFFNGEIYTMPAFATANIAGQTLYSAEVTTNAVFDPVRFSDGSTKNVHNIRQWVISQAGSGSNAFSTWLTPGAMVSGTVTLAMVTAGGGGTVTVAGGSVTYTKYRNISVVNLDVSFTTTGTSSQIVVDLSSFINETSKVCFGVFYDTAGNFYSANMASGILTMNRPGIAADSYEIKGQITIGLA